MTIAEANRVTVRRYYEEILNQRNLALVEELFASDFTSHLRSGESDLPTYVASIKRSLLAFPDLHVTIGVQVAEGEIVATRWSAQGTHEGVFGNVQPTGRVITLEAMDFHRLSDGKIREHWQQMDLMGILQQIGTLSQMSQQASKRRSGA